MGPTLGHHPPSALEWVSPPGFPDAASQSDSEAGPSLRTIKGNSCPPDVEGKTVPEITTAALGITGTLSQALFSAPTQCFPRSDSSFCEFLLLHPDQNSQVSLKSPGAS
jgi:hypothetical protein